MTSQMDAPRGWMEWWIHYIPRNEWRSQPSHTACSRKKRPISTLVRQLHRWPTHHPSWLLPLRIFESHQSSHHEITTIGSFERLFQECVSLCRRCCFLFDYFVIIACLLDAVIDRNRAALFLVLFQWILLRTSNPISSILGDRLVCHKGRGILGVNSIAF